MLRITMGSASAWNSWFSDFGNHPQGIGRLREIVDAACRDVGRDPGDITTIEDEGSVEEARSAWEQMRAAMATVVSPPGLTRSETPCSGPLRVDAPRQKV